jgi:hypothetical protein
MIDVENRNSKKRRKLNRKNLSKKKRHFLLKGRVHPVGKAQFVKVFHTN